METLSVTSIQPHQIVKEGYLERKGNYLRQWKKTWVVLASHKLYTFNKEKEYANPIQVIELSTIDSIATNEEKNILCLTKTDEYYNTYFKFNKLSEMNEWVNILAGYINIIQIPITITCDDEKEYCMDFHTTVPYHENYKYKISQLIDDIIQYIQRKYHPTKFGFNEIDNQSFVSSKDTNTLITHYKKQEIIAKGLIISVNILDNTCKYMKNKNDLCEIYAEMMFHNICTEEGLKHLLEYKHFEYMYKPECKEREQCESYQRLLNGGNKLNDRCHIKIYKHHYIAPLQHLNDVQSSNNIQRGILKNAEVLEQINKQLLAIDIKTWQNSRNYAILQIITLANLFEKQVRDVGIAKSSGGGASIVGGTLVIVGLALLPVSGGVSLGLSIAGGSTMLAGGLTTVGSGFVKHFLENKTVKKCISAYECTQKETRRIAFLLEDYGVTFTAIKHNISAFNALCMGGSIVSNSVSIVSLAGMGKAVKEFNAIKSAVALGTVAVEDGAVASTVIAEEGLCGGIVAKNMGKAIAKLLRTEGAENIAEIGNFCGKSLGYAGGALGIVFGLYDIFNGIKTYKDAENAIHKLRLLAIDVDSQTEMIMKQYNNVLNLKNATTATTSWNV